MQIRSIKKKVEFRFVSLTDSVNYWIIQASEDEVCHAPKNQVKILERDLNPNRTDCCPLTMCATDHVDNVE